jgi:hypothetical protein
MANKIKITEGQLKKMMANRINEQYEGDVEESAAGGVGLSKMMDLTDKLNSMTASYIRQVKEAISENGFGDYQERYDELLSQLSNGLSVDGGEESNMGDEYADTKDIPGFEGTMDSLNSLSIREDDEMMNESIKKIKSEFNRFL